MGIEIENFLNELKKCVYIKTKIIDGVEKKVGFDFEEKAYQLASNFLTSCNWKTPVVTATQTPKEPEGITPEQIQESVEKIANTTEDSVDAAMQSVLNSIQARGEEKKVIEEVKKSEPKEPKVKVEVPDEFAKALPEPNAPMPPVNQKETVGSCDQYFKQHGIKAYKTPEWFGMKFEAYGIPKSMYEGVENLHDLHRRWLGPIDSNGKFILWQFAWIKYNHENGKPLFENTFVVDKTRLTKYYQDDVSGKPSVQPEVSAPIKNPEPEVKIEEKTETKTEVSAPVAQETADTSDEPLPLKPRKKKEVDSIKPPKPAISGGTGEKKSVNFD